MWMLAATVAGAADLVLDEAAGIHGACPAPGAGGRVFGTTWWPVGFSPDGAFASVALTTGDALDEWVFRVQSLVTDQELAAVRWSEPTDRTVAGFLAHDREAIAAALTAHGIAPSEAVLATLPAKRGERTYAVTTRAEPDEDPELPGRWVTTISDGTGSKVLDQRPARSVAVTGWLVSRSEPRAAVVLTQEQAAFEGTVNCRIVVVGAHLETGFR
ncbi:MAG: hypothetical protein KC621_18055 [Myxococcales bacterium]|nr:hypothetical protein [Myxococcales bacterium]